MSQPTLTRFLEALREKFYKELQAKPAWSRAEARLAFERSTSYVLATLIEESEENKNEPKPWTNPIVAYRGTDGSGAEQGDVSEDSTGVGVFHHPGESPKKDV